MLERMLNTAFALNVTQVIVDAFHIVTTTDPLADSDDEDDEHVRLDYGQ